jgi:hypothetical protein
MCLYIKSDQYLNERDLKKWFGNRTKFAYVYKRLHKWSEENFYRSLVYNHFKWDFSKQKVFEVRRDPKPTEEELRYRRINEGLHVYTNLETARRDGYGNSVVKFRVNKEDIVAIDSIYTEKEAVCTRLEFVKVLED